MELVLLLNIYKIHIQYKGTQYLGFQVQSEGSTIQGEINRALKTISKSEEIKTIGSGRTDSGVHALGQVLRIEIPIDIEPESLVKAMNSHLPTDIRVISASRVQDNFHPIYSAKSKEYNYVFCLDSVPSPFLRELVTYFPKDLDVDLMQKAAQEFCGEFDFINYQCVGTEISSTIRTIMKCEIMHCKSTDHWAQFTGDYYVLKIVGNGFLKQMVRLIMGALVSVGRGKVSLVELRESLQKPLQNRLGPTAPPQGLYLLEVHY